MLSRLHIENVAVIENADLELDYGLNVLTGETGAGKSILIDSINFVLGERISKEIVRSGAKSAHVSAIFINLSQSVKDVLTELGFEYGEDGLLIQRDLTADGRGTCRIAGRLATVSILREIGQLLVNIHGQHDNQDLLSPEKHIYYVNRYANLEKALANYQDVYSKMSEIKHNLAKLLTDEAEKARRVDLLNYQINEIETADLKQDEDRELQDRKNLIVNAEKISRAVNEAYCALSGGEELETGAKDLIANASDALLRVADVYPELSNLAQRLENTVYEIGECINDLRPFTGELEFDSRELDHIEQRLDLIYRLKKKYGESIEEISAFLEKSHNELNRMENAQADAEELQKQLAEFTERADKAASVLSMERKKAAAEMELKIQEELKFLDMPDVRFVVQFEPLETLNQNGRDKVEFLISANPGSPPRSLAKIASGGELSRIMLAIKNILAGNDDIETLIFDEIDTGVSGRAAQKIGLKLHEVSKGRQIICVTHLAQIASQSDRHILIEKKISDGNTYTKLRTLDFNGRKHELARIIGGADITEITLQNAEEMLLTAGIKQE